jgi:hypothetical protein
MHARGRYHTGDVGELVYDYDVVPNSYAHPPRLCGHTWTRQPLLRIIDRVQSLEEVYVAGDSRWIATSDLEVNFYGKL